MSQEKSFGIVVFDLGSGDTAVYFVDEVRWGQIASIGIEVADFDEAQEWAGYLTNDDGDSPRPKGCPERRGAVLKTVFCQTFVTELFSEVQGRVLGIVAFPA
jgi:hypothetical protein